MRALANADASRFGVSACGGIGTRLAFYVHILASRRDGTLYVGVTNDLARRVHEHKAKTTPGFTATYGVDRLVWYETYPRIMEAIDREKALKKWRRAWKIRSIEDLNPDWSDLYQTLNGWTGLG